MNAKSKKVRRLKSGKKSYKYVHDETGKSVTDQKIIDYIKSLTIPPAYSNVIISLNPKDDVAYIGYDAMGREQRIYSKVHNVKATNKKYCSLSKFIKLFPKITKDINNILKSSPTSPEEQKEKNIAIILKIMSLCYFRVGNEKYKKKYNSYGISTIEKKHLKLKGKDIIISFVGKKGVTNTCTISDQHIIKILTTIYKNKKNTEPLFDGVTSNEINAFLKKYDQEFTSKIYRTYYANVKIIQILNTSPIAETENQRKKQVVESVDCVAELLHHTKAICRKKYIDSTILDMYITDPEKYKKQFASKTSNKSSGLDTYLKEKC